MSKTLKYLLTTAVMMFAAVLLTTGAYATEVRSGTVTGNVVNIRETPSASGKWLMSVPKGGKVIINKTKVDCDLKGKDISVTLTQAETLALTAENKAEIQLRVLTTDGLALASAIFRENTDCNLKDGVIEQSGVTQATLQLLHSQLLHSQLLPLKHKSPNLEKVLEIDQRQARPNAMGAQGEQVFSVDLDVRAPACRRGPAHAHHDHALRQIRHLKLREIQVAQLQLEVCTDTIVK